MELVPHLTERLLPSKKFDSTQTEGGFHEREIIFKFLLEMKSDLSDLKSLIYELIRTNDLTLPDISALKNMSSYNAEALFTKNYPTPASSMRNEEYEPYDNKPILLQNKQNFHQTDEVEEIKSIEEMEKDMIRKALKNLITGEKMPQMNSVFRKEHSTAKLKNTIYLKNCRL